MRWLVEYTRGGSRGYHRVDAGSESEARAAASRELGSETKTWSVERDMRRAKQQSAGTNNDTHVDPFENVSEEAAESIAEQANDLGEEGGVIALPDGVREDQVEPILDALAKVNESSVQIEPHSFKAFTADEIAQLGSHVEGSCATCMLPGEPGDALHPIKEEKPQVIRVEILSPVRCDGVHYPIGAVESFRPAIAERLIECGSAKRIE